MVLVHTSDRIVNPSLASQLQPDRGASLIPSGSPLRSGNIQPIEHVDFRVYARRGFTRI
jgi:hypothetical protein